MNWCEMRSREERVNGWMPPKVPGCCTLSLRPSSTGPGGTGTPDSRVETALISPQTAANPTRPSHAVSRQRSGRLRPASREEGRCHRATPVRGPFPMGLRTSRGWARGGCRQSWAPSCCCCCCSRAAAEAVAAGALCRSRRRGCGRAGDSAKREASAEPVCAIELLIHRKKGGRGREKKKKSHVRVIRMWRSSRRREK